MKLALKPVELPFMIGDTVWVDQPFGAVNEFPFFQGTIMQIILDGSMANTLVVRHRTDIHELVVSHAIYGLAETGRGACWLATSQCKRTAYPLQNTLFATKEGLVDYQNQEN